VAMLKMEKAVMKKVKRGMMINKPKNQNNHSNHQQPNKRKSLYMQKRVA
jgi:hypothetical protein